MAAIPTDVIPKSNAAAEKALELDPTLARPHAAPGRQQGAVYDWDFAGGEAEFRKALELDPSDATAHQWYSEDLAYIGGRAQEAIDEANRARQLDPLSPIIGNRASGGLPQTANLIRRSRSDKKVHRRQSRLWQSARSPGGLRIGPSISIRRPFRNTRPALNCRATRISPSSPAALDAGFRSGGWPAALRKAIEVSLAQRKAKTELRFSVMESRNYMPISGDKEHAFEWLNTAYQEHDPGLASLPTDFRFDSLRSDPRYAELVRKIGFPQ